MKKTIALLLAAEFVIAFFFAPVCVLRGDMTHAFVAYHQNPTAETKAELDKQGRITSFHRLGVAGVAFCVMAGVTLLVACLTKRRAIA